MRPPIHPAWYIVAFVVAALLAGLVIKWVRTGQFGCRRHIRLAEQPQCSQELKTAMFRLLKSAFAFVALTSVASGQQSMAHPEKVTLLVDAELPVVAAVIPSVQPVKAGTEVSVKSAQDGKVKVAYGLGEGWVNIESTDFAKRPAAPATKFHPQSSDAAEKDKVKSKTSEIMGVVISVVGPGVILEVKKAVPQHFGDSRVIFLQTNRGGMADGELVKVNARRTSNTFHYRSSDKRFRALRVWTEEKRQ